MFSDPSRVPAGAPGNGMWARTGLGPGVAAALFVWLALHVGAFAAVAPVLWLPSLAALLAGTVLAVGLMARHYPHPVFGWCNAVTLVRASLTAALMTPLVAGAPAGWPVACIAAVALALDGIDGHLARSHGRVSKFGARFDMEVDSALALVMAANAAAAGGSWLVVLFLGLARYLFVAASAALPWLSAPLPPSFRRKAVCVVQLSALIVLQLPPLPQAAAMAIAVGASAALAWSFAVDILWLARRRG